MRAWVGGDYDRCLTLCDLVERRCASLAVDVSVLRVRALLRLGRAVDALAVVERVLAPAGALDASFTARMLQGTALVRLGRIQAGLAILDRVQAAADGAGAHPAIRAEIALCRSLAHYCLRDLGAAETALHDIGGDSDVVHALALNYRGWIATARGEYRGAVELFVASLAHLDGCRRYDRVLEANCLQTLSAFAAERLDRALWQFVDARAKRMIWAGSGFAEARFWVAMASCAMEELEGRNVDAVRAARLAEELAPSDAYRIQARLQRAAIARLLGEVATQYDHVTSARELFDRLDPEALTADERNVALTLAEELAHVGAVDDARRALASYRAHPVSALVSPKDDRRVRAYERLVEAQIAEAAGDRVQAHHGYRDAFQVFRATGHRRRALIAALRLAEIGEQPYLYEYVATELREFSAGSWFRREAGSLRGVASRDGSVPTPARRLEIVL